MRFRTFLFCLVICVAGVLSHMNAFGQGTSSDGAKPDPRIVAYIAAQREANVAVLDLMQTIFAIDLKCEVTERGETQLDKIVCQSASGEDLCLFVKFADGVEQPVDRCYPYQNEMYLFDSTRIPVGPSETHLLQSWAVWGADATEPDILNIMYVQYNSGEWVGILGGYGAPPARVAQAMYPQWLNRTAEKGRVIPDRQITPAQTGE